MARSTKEIYELMRSKQASLLQLSGVLDPAESYDDYIDKVKSNSKLSDHSHMLYQFAYHASMQEQLWDEYRAEIQALADSEEIGTGPWFERILDEFQVFDEPIVIDGRTTYAVIDESKRIVARRSVDVNSDGVYVIKVAKENAPGVYGPLDDTPGNDEYGSLQSYLTKRMFLTNGQQFDLISIDADRLRLYGTVFYDAVLDIDDVKASVKASIDNYLNNLDFSGKVYLQKITDAIQAATGVRDVSPLGMNGYSSGTPVPAEQFYDPESGYVIEDPAATFLTILQFQVFEG